MSSLIYQYFVFLHQHSIYIELICALLYVYRCVSACTHAITWTSIQELYLARCEIEGKKKELLVQAKVQLTIAKSKHLGSNTGRPNINLPHTSEPA